jgi:RNA polymerase sigma factor (sigma-70 family)
MTRTAEHQARIDQINIWVQEYKDGDVEAANKLIEQFKPFLAKQSNRWDKIYSGVHPWDHIMQEAMTIFFKLLGEYTIGGPAYFNVFIERKLPLRLRYFFIKEIKRRGRELSHSDEQMRDDNLIGSVDNIGDLVIAMGQNDRLKEIWDTLGRDDVLTDRERDMVIQNIIHEVSHEKIAAAYGISRSRVSRIIKKAIERLQEEVRYR